MKKFQDIISGDCGDYFGDGYCDDTLNIPSCDYDGGDCCGPDVMTHFCYACECLTGGSEDGNKEENETSSGGENSGIEIRWNIIDFYSNGPWMNEWNRFILLSYTWKHT